MAEEWLLIDVSSQGEVKFAVMAAAVPGAMQTLRFDTRELPTFTDALMRYSAETGRSLLDLTAAVAVAGAVAGETISVARSRWIISRSGLASMFGRPVTVVNEVAARAWATLDGTTVRARLHGAGDPTTSAPGRTAMITLEDGVGAATIDVDRRGAVAVYESEAGHMEFAPIGEAEEQLCRSLRSGTEQPSWEQVLMAALADDRVGALDLAARLVGRFAGNVVLGMAAWRGVMLTGRRGRALAAAPQGAFAQGFAMRRGFSRQLAAAPCWLIDQNEPVLAGLAALLAERGRTPDRP